MPRPLLLAWLLSGPRTGPLLKAPRPALPPPPDTAGPPTAVYDGIAGSRGKAVCARCGKLKAVPWPKPLDRPAAVSRPSTDARAIAAWLWLRATL